MRSYVVGAAGWSGELAEGVAERNRWNWCGSGIMPARLVVEALRGSRCWGWCGARVALRLPVAILVGPLRGPGKRETPHLPFGYAPFDPSTVLRICDKLASTSSAPRQGLIAS